MDKNIECSETQDLLFANTGLIRVGAGIHVRGLIKAL